MLEHTNGIVDRLGTMAAVIREQQEVTSKVAESLAAQAEAMARLQEGEKQLIQLQETMNRNLQTLAGAGAFEEAVHSLAAAVHLLTARASVPISNAVSSPILAVKRPGVAA
jgi:soluble cytochrome b562